VGVPSASLPASRPSRLCSSNTVPLSKTREWKGREKHCWVMKRHDGGECESQQGGQERKVAISLPYFSFSNVSCRPAPPSPSALSPDWPLTGR